MNIPKKDIASVPTPSVGSDEVPFFEDKDTGAVGTKDENGDFKTIGDSPSASGQGKSALFTAKKDGILADTPAFSGYGIFTITAGV